MLLITGTNGKTTTARLLARMAKDAGYTVGNSSTDGLSVNGLLWTEGTGLGQERRVRFATPRRGIRGLRNGARRSFETWAGGDGLRWALVTNTLMTTSEITESSTSLTWRARGRVYSVVSPEGTRVFNVDNVYSRRSRIRILALLSLRLWKVEKRLLHRPMRRTCCLFGEWDHLPGNGDHVLELIQVSHMPMAREGAALHDISNALGAIALGWSVGLPIDSLRMTLERFGGDWNDNPGRGRMIQLNGIRVLLDFGHNPHGVHAVLAMARRLTMNGGRMGVCFAQAGDRSDEDFDALAQTVARFAPDKVYLRDLPEAYHRGRTADGMAERPLALANSENPPSDVERVPNVLTALTSGMDWARPGDLLVHLVHLERESVEGWLRHRGGEPC